MRHIRHKLSKSAGLLVLAISAVLVMLALGAASVLGNDQHRASGSSDEHRTSGSSPPANPRVSAARVCTGIALAPTSNVQAAINNAPPGTTLGWAWDAGIQLRRSGGLSASTPVIISGNIVANNYKAISLIESPRAGCAPTHGLPWYGPCKVQNVLVENNWITMTQGATGAWQDGEGNGIFTSQNNVFQNNHYCVTSVAHPNDGYTFAWFGWMNSWLDFSTWEVTWLERAGMFTVGGSCHP